VSFRVHVRTREESFQNGDGPLPRRSLPLISMSPFIGGQILEGAEASEGRCGVEEGTCHTEITEGLARRPGGESQITEK